MHLQIKSLLDRSFSITTNLTLPSLMKKDIVRIQIFKSCSCPCTRLGWFVRVSPIDTHCRAWHISSLGALDIIQNGDLMIVSSRYCTSRGNHFFAGQSRTQGTRHNIVIPSCRFRGNSTRKRSSIVSAEQTGCYKYSLLDFYTLTNLVPFLATSSSCSVPRIANFNLC